MRPHPVRFSAGNRWKKDLFQAKLVLYETKRTVCGKLSLIAMRRGCRPEHIGLDAILGEGFKELVALLWCHSVISAAINNHERTIVLIHKI